MSKSQNRMCISFVVCLIISIFYCMTTVHAVESEITKNPQFELMEIKGVISLLTDEGGRKKLVITVTNNTDKILWVPKFSSTENVMACESVNWFDTTGNQKTLLVHSDYGLCSYPLSYDKLLPRKSAKYITGYSILDKYNVNIENLMVQIWAPWRSPDGEFVDKNLKLKSLKDEILIENIYGLHPNNKKSKK